MKYEKTELITEGKTKKLWGVKGEPNLVLVENKTDITAFDDPSKTKQFETKAKYATETTCRVFELLQKTGIPVAYVEQVSKTEFLVPKVEMIPLECVIRRLAVGSVLKRRPDYKQPEGQKPLRFHRLVFELFLKTTAGKLVKNDKTIIDDLQKGEDDPLILNPHDNSWNLYHSKIPSWQDGANINRVVNPADIVFPDNVKTFRNINVVKIMEDISRQAFLVLEGAWAQLGFLLVDYKIEFGWTADGQVVIADVIDNDSWRLKDPNFNELSKQEFRDGKPMDEIEAKYGFVADCVNQFRIPKQAVVLWKGSPSDQFPELPEYVFSKDKLIPGLSKVEITMSGHKKTQECLVKLEEIQREFPEGGVIITEVGMSNGLGPTLASHTSWPVIARPADENFADDVWSSLRMPSSNAMATILSKKNAVLYALNILARKNPAIYMMRQFEIEELDKGY